MALKHSIAVLRVLLSGMFCGVLLLSICAFPGAVGQSAVVGRSPILGEGSVADNLDIASSGKGKNSYSAPQIPHEDVPSPELTLTGGVEHAVTWPPVSSPLQVGAIYDDAKLEKPPRQLNWYKVPTWLEGSWKSDTQTSTTVEDLKTGRKISNQSSRNEGVARYGVQRDEKTGVWDYVFAPQKVESSSELFIYKDLVTKQVLMKDAKNVVVLKDVFTRRKVSKANKKIVEITQMEQISALRPSGKNLITLVGSLKVFDKHGKALRLITATVSYRRSEPFKQVNFDKATHEDLRPSFKAFLEASAHRSIRP